MQTPGIWEQHLSSIQFPDLTLLSLFLILHFLQLKIWLIFLLFFKGQFSLCIYFFTYFPFLNPYCTKEVLRSEERHLTHVNYQPNTELLLVKKGSNLTVHKWNIITKKGAVFTTFFLSCVSWLSGKQSHHSGSLLIDSLDFIPAFYFHMDFWPVNKFRFYVNIHPFVSVSLLFTPQSFISWSIIPPFCLLVLFKSEQKKKQCCFFNYWNTFLVKIQNNSAEQMVIYICEQCEYILMNMPFLSLHWNK